MRQDAAGLETEPFAVLVERGKILEFARATFSEHPELLADRPVAPPTFLTTQNFWAQGEADVWHLLEIDWAKALHLEQEYAFAAGPPRAGDVLTGRTRVVDLARRIGRAAGEMTVATTVTEFRDPAGSLVATGRAVMAELDVALGTRHGSVGAGSGGSSDGSSGGAGSAPGGGGVIQAETEDVGPRPDGVPAPPPPLVVGPLTRTDIVRYQGASGDMNAIHHDEPLALGTGLPATLSVGMLQAGMTASWAMTWLGAGAVRRFGSRFLRPVFPGDTLISRGRCLEVVLEGGGPVARVEVTCAREGVPVVVSTGTFRLG